MQAKLDELRRLAKAYYEADRQLGQTCTDPIAYTVYAVKGRHTDALPAIALLAGKLLGQVVDLHHELVNDYGMDTDDVRAVWFPILNQ